LRVAACRPPFISYNFRVLDIKLIREKPEFVRERLARRGAGDERQVDAVLALDEARRGALAEGESLKAVRNRVSKEIGALMGQKKTAEAEAKKLETRQLGDKIALLDKAASGAEADLRAEPDGPVAVPDAPEDRPCEANDVAESLT